MVQPSIRSPPTARNYLTIFYQHYSSLHHLKYCFLSLCTNLPKVTFCFDLQVMVVDTKFPIILSNVMWHPYPGTYVINYIIIRLLNILNA